MKTKIIILFLAFFSTTIIYGQKKVSKKSQYLTKTLNEGTGYMPKGTKVSVLKKYDKKTNTDIEIVIPVSGNTKFDTQLHRIIENKKTEFLEDCSVVEMRNYFEVRPISIYISQKIISFAFEIGTENGGAAHGEAIYYSYNYDVAKNKEIKFEDYFTIELDEDKEFVTGLIYESVKLKDEEEGVNGPFAEFGVDFSDVDFNVQKDTITFNLGSIRSYADGIFRAELNKSKLGKFINNNYR
ncbi:MAG: hypothetical protein WCL51_12380 [Bacteroidota bacterium]